MRDVDHLVTVNNNGLWIKENLGKNGIRIIHAKKLEQNKLLDLKILHLDDDSKLKEKIVAKSAKCQDE